MGSQKKLKITFENSKHLEKSFQLPTDSFLFLQYLISETFGKRKVDIEASCDELSHGAKKLWFPLKDGKTMCRKFTKPQVGRYLKQFEKLGLIRVN